MKSFTLGTHTIPALGFGTWQIPNEIATQAVQTALEVGYRHIDCAAAYGNQTEVGAGIKQSGVAREDIFITSKVWRTDMRAGEVINACHKIMQELGVEYLDLLLMHWPDRTIPMAETLDQFVQLQEQGLIREWGVSNCTPHHLQDMRDLGYQPVNDQVEFHPSLNQDALLAYCEEHDIRLTAYSPIAQGADLKLAVVQELAEEYGVSASQVILNWLIAKNIVAIPKASSREHIQDNFEALNWEMDEGDLEKMEGLDRGNRLINPPWGEFGY